MELFKKTIKAIQRPQAPRNVPPDVDALAAEPAAAPDGRRSRILAKFSKKGSKASPESSSSDAAVLGTVPGAMANADPTIKAITFPATVVNDQDVITTAHLADDVPRSRSSATVAHTIPNPTIKAPAFPETDVNDQDVIATAHLPDEVPSTTYVDTVIMAPAVSENITKVTAFATTNAARAVVTTTNQDAIVPGATPNIGLSTLNNDNTIMSTTDTNSHDLVSTPSTLLIPSTLNGTIISPYTGIEANIINAHTVIGQFIALDRPAPDSSLVLKHDFSPSPPTSIFTGRADILLQLKKCFIDDLSSLKQRAQQRCVLYGIGGAGKTQIVLKFVHEFESRFSFIFMVDASSNKSLMNFFTALAYQANIADATYVDGLKWLCNRKTEWLLIFDNADDVNLDLQPFFPLCSHGNVLITSRNEAYKIYATGDYYYRIQNMSIHDSLLLFAKASHRKDSGTDPATMELMEELGYLALAITQAAGYLFQNEYMKISQYLINYRKNKPKYLAQLKMQKVDAYEYSVYATWGLSYEKLDENAKQLLMLFSVGNCTKIPINILEKAWNNISRVARTEVEELQQFLLQFLSEDEQWNNDVVETGIESLKGYSLVEIRDSGAIVLNMHSLVHSWCYESMSVSKKELAQILASQLYLCIGSGNYDYYEAQSWVPHLRALLKIARVTNETAKILSKIFAKALMWSETEILQQQVVEACTESFGKHHLDTIQAMTNLGETFWQASKLDQAEQLFQKVLNNCREMFGELHPDTIKAMDGLGATFWQAGKLDQAEQLAQKVLNARKEVFGELHPDTIEAMANLGATFQKAGKLGQAEQLHQKVLNASRQVFGEIHPNTIDAMANLAAFIRQTGKLDQAEQLEQKVLNSRRKVFGELHPDTIRAMANLGATFQQAGKLDQAEQLQHKVLNARREAFGELHPDTIQAMANIGVTFWQAGKLDQAEQFEQKVLKAHREAFGELHPYTIEAMANLGATFRQAGKLNHAEQLEQKVLNARTEAFGEHHPDTLKAMINLSATFREAVKLDKAEQLGQKVLNFHKEAFGELHPNTIQAMANLGATFQMAGKLDQAQQLHQKVLNAGREAFGELHPDTIHAMANLAAIFRQAGKLDQAEQLEQKVLNDCRKAFGELHPDTIRAMANLGATCWQAGKLDQAEQLAQKVLNARTEAFGELHPDTIQAMANVGATFQMAGKLDQAEQLAQKVLNARRQVFGELHPGTIQAMSNLAAIFRHAGKLDQAEQLEQKVQNSHKEAFAELHSDTIEAMANIGATFGQAGKLDHA